MATLDEADMTVPIMKLENVPVPVFEYRQGKSFLRKGWISTRCRPAID
jgi:hypothetical protein